MPKRMRTLVAIAVTLGTLIGAAPAMAVNFEPGAGTYTVDTTTLSLTGPGTAITGTDQGGVAVFSFDNVSIPSTATIEVEGTRPFKLVASGTLTVAGLIDGSGFSASDFVAGPNPGGPGGGAGGASFIGPGSGPGGGGVASNRFNGGGGGGFGGVGARGGIKPGDTGSAGGGGAAYGDLNAVLQGGSGGGGASESSAVGGGGGGGAIALFGATVTITASGGVAADGGDGATGGDGASGGGSGGGILVRGDVVQVAGVLSAAGGDGGAGGCCGDGGGGGGGRVALQGQSLTANGPIDVLGGISGVASTGIFTSGGASPDPTGAPGVVTKIQAPSVSTGIATAVSSSGATLNGAVGPGSSATTYRFEFGTTTAYGSRVPASDAFAGADAGTHAVAQAVSGLTPNTTYHFRIVATNALGFVTAGTDQTFTTAPICKVPKVKGKKVRAARKAIKKANCKVGKVKKVFSSKVKKGRVVSQRPKAGKTGPAGMKVKLKVSKGEKPS